MELPGKVALVTGGLRGIGRAIAVAMARAGADLLIAGRSMDTAAETEQEIRALGRQCATVHADVSNEDAVKELIATAVRHYGRLDILVNNAAIAPFKPIEDLTVAEFSRVLEVNLKGPWLCAKYALPELKRRRGVILNITSASGHYGGATSGGSAYDASKGGLQQLTYSLAAEFGPYGIRVNAIAPGTIIAGQAGGQAFVESELGRNELGRTPLRRLGVPEDVANVAVFLACNASSYINGTTIILDGGTMAVW
jgi:NAD(P)-dependent dehydrogenase (short-subunit alcohol dehydrogenase family)